MLTQMQQENILIWLPAPMGDAILCTPALRAVREHFDKANITFLASMVVRQALSPCRFCDEWLDISEKNAFSLSRQLKKYKFDQVLLFKNSFGSALIAFLAGIPTRIGYARDGRGFLLTDRLIPAKLPDGKFKPLSMLDYYGTIAAWTGADTTDRKVELEISEQDKTSLLTKLPNIENLNGPLIILVPGGAFGLSKCWPSERFARAADRLIEKHNATVIVSVAPNDTERKIAGQICTASSNKLINLGDNPLTLGELKALFQKANLVICNDTGPRHIAIALGCKIVTMFGPNNPAWTLTGYKNEVQIVGKAPCAPCLEPRCKLTEHLCMESISVDHVCHAADELLSGKDGVALSDWTQIFDEVSEGFFVDTNYIELLKNIGLSSLDDVFAFDKGDNLGKKNLASYRSRMKFQAGSPEKTFYFKRYKKPPLNFQLKNWFSHHSPITCAMLDVYATKKLTASGINTPKIIAYGEEKKPFFEERSFTITEEIPNAQSLEKKLPDYFYQKPGNDTASKRREFIKKLARFIRTFHNTGFRHRDLYLCHIFCNDKEEFTLIDLARCFEPAMFADRFKVKDITQLYYSAPKNVFSRADRLRFYKYYTGNTELAGIDEQFITNVFAKAKSMARHDRNHSRAVPYEDK